MFRGKILCSLAPATLQVCSLAAEGRGLQENKSHAIDHSLCMIDDHQASLNQRFLCLCCMTHIARLIGTTRHPRLTILKDHYLVALFSCVSSLNIYRPRCSSVRKPRQVEASTCCGVSTRQSPCPDGPSQGRPSPFSPGLRVDSTNSRDGIYLQALLAFAHHRLESVVTPIASF